MKYLVSILLLGISLYTVGNTQPVQTAQTFEIKDEAKRQIYSLNEDWFYLEDDLATVAEVEKSQKTWENIHLPHTWNIWDAVDPIPGYRRAGSWYKKLIQMPKLKNNLRFILSFEGVNISSEIYVNGIKAGGHIGGYVGFEVDITPYLQYETQNTILVYVSNVYNPQIIPSQKSDFHIYGGITRNVWLKIVPSVHLKKMKILTPKVTKAKADIQVEVNIQNYSSLEVPCDIETRIIDRKGKDAGIIMTQQRLSRGSTSLTVTMPSIQKPQLWSPQDPALYTMYIYLKNSGKIIDSISDQFGCRWFEFKAHGPFYLNGERLLLRGTHRHEDYAGYANAMPDSLHRRDMKMIKEMGANFVRLAHYPQAPEVYRACDELGIIVWDELPWCRGGMGGEEWKANTGRLLTEQIEENFNHPSIIIHSLGNELYWLPDFHGGDNLDSLHAMIKELNAIAHNLDPSRATATRKFTEGADLVDIVSPSIWPGWYSGNYKGFENAIMDSHKMFSYFLHVEYGGDSHVGRHTETPVAGDVALVPKGFEEQIKLQTIENVSQFSDWSENYIVDLFDWYLHISERLDWITGNAQWAFKDFPTPLRPENPIPYINQKGLVDRAGNPKDAYYVFKSYWTTNPLFCYIESHTWTERSGPESLKREVNVFSNCPEAELFLNDVSQGRRVRDIKNFPACGLSWQVNFMEGQNSLIVKGYKAEKEVTADSLTVHYSFKKNEGPDRIILTSKPLPSGNLLITALVVDKNGNRCLDYNKRLYFAWDGPGRLLENYGTPTRSSIIEMANGKAQIEYEPAYGKGKTVIEARNQDLKGDYLLIGN